VTDKLTKEGISFDLVDDTCLVLANNTKVEGIVALNKEVVVQDRSSQRVLDLLPSSLHRQDLKAWDCCAASGGKSILLWDQFSLQHLAVSDVRQSILHNLKSRFREAGISNYHSLVADLSGGSHSPGSKFDLVICDAPCSGSGTWGRTPEQLRFFTKEKIEHYTGLQQRIAGNASKGVKEGGYFLYITCSVFSKENEEVADHIQESTSLQHVESRYFKGYHQKADTLFAALFRL
jgi:16S rRNA (cytosine967-C5)-methyltransferase